MTQNKKIMLIKDIFCKWQAMKSYDLDKFTIKKIKCNFIKLSASYCTNI